MQGEVVKYIKYYKIKNITIQVTEEGEITIIDNTTGEIKEG